MLTKSPDRPLSLLRPEGIALLTPSAAVDTNQFVATAEPPSGST